VASANIPHPVMHVLGAQAHRQPRFFQGKYLAP
jgi:hypothetical protein